ncbi:MAG TPA: alkaline phosphatase family protein [Terriglobales bacterium]|nr:alkaline phosphatase family protein [Terriglobales bacterium]
MFFKNLLWIACVSFLLALASVASFAQVPVSQHVVLVIDENHSFDEVMVNMPWLVAQGDANGYAANFKSDNGGSLLDYLWLASGSCHSKANCTLPPGTHDFNCNGNDCYYPGTSTTDPITDDSIFRELNNAGASWRVYAQSYGAAGGTLNTPDNANGTTYYRRHNGATWYADVLNDVDGSASNVVDLSQLAVDEANGTLPRFMIIAPDGNHDAHDCPVGMKTCTVGQALGAADEFLRTTLTPILSTPDFQPGGDGLLIVTFDECGGGTDNGCGAAIYTAVIGPKVRPHTVSKILYKHENTLRTLLDALQISTYPGAAARATDMSDFFTVEGSKPEVTVSSPADGASVSSHVKVEASAVPTAGHTISGWYVYVDNVAVYHAGAVNAIGPTLNMSTGPHTVIVRAWDTSGAYGDQTISVTVVKLAPFVEVSTPSNDANVGAPVNVRAAASPTAGHTISAWKIYVDGVLAYSAGAVTAIDTNIAMGLGVRVLLVRSWDTSGAYGDQTVNLTVSKKPAVTVSTPPPVSNVISPINIRAIAAPTSGHTITGWVIYLDETPVYRAGAVGRINTNITANVGKHTVLVRAWDSSNAYGDQALAVQIQQVAVNVSTPLNGAAVNSPVNIQAAASSAHNITGWHVYIDSIDSYGQTYGGALNINLAMGFGAHIVLVRAWDSTGAYGGQTINVTVP